MKKTLRGALALFMVLALLIPAGGVLAAQSELPVQTGLPMQTGTPAAQTESSLSHATTVRQILLASAVARPRASKAAGTYTSSFKFTLTTSTKSAKIYFTTDGSKPTAKSKPYTKTLTVKRNVTVKAVAIKSGKSSAVLTVAYKVRAGVPKANNIAGEYANSVSVKLTSDTADAKIYYTTDGSTPTKKSKLYSKAITVSKTTTIKAISVKSGMANSKVVTAKYTVYKAAYANRHGYLACTANEKQVYKALYDGMSKVSQKIKMPVKVKKAAALRVMERVRADNPDLFAWGTVVSHDTDDDDYMVSMSPHYKLTKSKQTSMQKELKTAAQKIVNKAKKEQDVVDQVNVIHDEIILNAAYDYDALDAYYDGGYVHNAHIAYGVLVSKLGVCESYARAFQYICQLMDIPAIVVVGDAYGNHMWNMVQIDGNWYHIDLTWDDPKIGQSDYISYNYFLLSDKEMQETRTFSPVAKGEQAMTELYNYYTLPKAPQNYTEQYNAA